MRKFHSCKLIIGVTLVLLVFGYRTFHPSTLEPESAALKTIDVDNSSCFDSLDVSMPLFLADLKNNSDYHGLRPWVSSKDGLSFGFRGLEDVLLHQSFIGRRIALVGDSTLFYPMKWLHALLTMAQPFNRTASFTNEAINFSNMSLHEARQKFPASLVNSSLRFDDPGTGTFITWMGKSGPSQGTHNFTVQWNRLINEVRPQVVVANMGLHWLHFMGSGRDTPGEVIQRWVKYEEWLDEIIANSKRAGATLVLFKTTNRVCDHQYVKAFKSANEKYRNSDNTTLSRCNELALQRAEPFNLTREQVSSYCSHGTMNEIGAAYLNERLYSYINYHSVAWESAGIRIGTFNDHDMESCNYTKDGRHYHMLNLVRLRLLANQLACILTTKPVTKAWDSTPC